MLDRIATAANALDPGCAGGVQQCRLDALAVNPKPMSRIWIAIRNNAIQGGSGKDAMSLKGLGSGTGANDGPQRGQDAVPEIFIIGLLIIPVGLISNHSSGAKKRCRSTKAGKTSALTGRYCRTAARATVVPG